MNFSNRKRYISIPESVCAYFHAISPSSFIFLVGLSAYLPSIDYPTNSSGRCSSVYQGIHVPLVSDKRYHLVQEILSKSGNRKSGRTKAILQGLIFCGYCKRPMTPSHSLNSQKIRYYYYRCTGTLSAEKGRIRCDIKYAPFATVEDSLFKILLSLSGEYGFKTLENRILKHNALLEKAIQQTEELNRMIKQKIEMTVSKKDKYFDSLITSRFSSSERQKINKRLDEIELEEKQLQATLHKQQFEISKIKDDLISVTGIKQQFITFRMDRDIFSQDELKDYLSNTIEKINYHPEKMIIKFKQIPWELDFEI